MIARTLAVVAVATLIIAGCSSDETEPADSTVPSTTSAETQPQTTTTTTEPPAPLTTAAPTSTTTTAPPEAPPEAPATPPADAPIDISAGVHHSCLIDSSGVPYCWGSNLHGQIGNGEAGFQAHSNAPVAVVDITDARQISAGWEHTCIVHATGEISCWGDNSRGELGNGDTADSVPTPAKVADITDATYVAAGHWHTCALHASGEVSCWGSNHDGQLGNGQIGDEADILVPNKVPGISDAVSVSTGGEHTCAVHATGEVSCWGDNWQGELGNRNYGSNQDLPSPTKAVGIDDAVAISTGTSHTCALRKNGKVSCWGSNTSGQVGDGVRISLDPITPFPTEVLSLSDATAVSVGESFSCALRVDNQISCWGSNEIGQHGNLPSASLITVSDIEDVYRFDAGSHHVCALRTNGAAYCWGSNIFSQLGKGEGSAYIPVITKVDGITTATDVSAAFNHTCVILESGEVSCWGRGWKGTDGDFESRSIRPLPTLVSGVDDAIQISADSSASCALNADRVLFCWGRLLGNSYVSNDDGTISPVAVNTPLQAPADTSRNKKIATASGHFCALHEDGTITCAGSNNYGQLGSGLFNPSSFDWTPVRVVGVDNAVDLSLGFHHTCAVLSTGEVSCWGRNDHGQLGIGEANIGNHSTIPTTVLNITDAVAVATGTQTSTCALHETGAVSCWGQDTLGELGTGSEPPVDHSSVPIRIRGLPDAVAITAGANHICALTVDSEVYCWGSSEYGQLASPEPIADGFSALPLRVSDISDAVAISAGTNHTCAVHASGEVTCWGAGLAGQLGNGQTAVTLSILPTEVSAWG